LHPNYPNPFNASTQIRYDIPESGTVTLSIFNLTGQLIQTFVEDHRAPGSYQLYWNGRDSDGRSLGSGLYFVTMRAGDFVSARKLVLVR
jgi:flagellar hook assembly protein FlgD